MTDKQQNKHKLIGVFCLFGLCSIIIASSAFDNKLLIKQHRLVNDLLKPIIPNIHGLTLLTFTPEQWEKEVAKQKA